MAEWIDVARNGDFPPGSRRCIDVGGRAIAVFNVAGRYYAIADTCTHEAESLSDGFLEGCEITCPRHGARFSLIDGAALSPPAWEPVDTYPVRIAGGMVQVADRPGT